MLFEGCTLQRQYFSSEIILHSQVLLLWISRTALYITNLHPFERKQDLTPNHHLITGLSIGRNKYTGKRWREFESSCSGSSETRSSNCFVLMLLCCIPSILDLLDGLTNSPICTYGLVSMSGPQ